MKKNASTQQENYTQLVRNTILNFKLSALRWILAFYQQNEKYDIMSYYHLPSQFKTSITGRELQFVWISDKKPTQLAPSISNHIQTKTHLLTEIIKWCLAIPKHTRNGMAHLPQMEFRDHQLDQNSHLLTRPIAG